MDNELKVEDSNKNFRMGASGNLNAARLAALQEKKISLEEKLSKKNQQLRELCIKEAELTGIIPSEIPLEPGESPPTFRRRVGTAFQLPQNLINNFNTEEDSVTSIEVNMQLLANMAEAALSLANESNINKTMRRQHMQQYQLHRQQYHLLEEKLAVLKSKSQADQSNRNMQFSGKLLKQKKKTREPVLEDSVSCNISFRQDLFGKPVFRHSLRSLQYPEPEQKILTNQKLGYRSLDCDSNSTLYRPEETLLPGIYKLSLNGYKDYIERKESDINQYSNQPYVLSQPNINLQQRQYKTLQYVPSNGTLPHNFSKNLLSSHNSANSYPNLQNPQTHYIQNNHSPNSSPNYEQKKYYTIGVHGTNSFPNSLNRQISNSNFNNNNHLSYYGSQNLAQFIGSNQAHSTLNPHQIQPHQQYENTAGLGGYWKQTDTGEMVWCNTVAGDNWKQEKRFGSLDRRRNKRTHHKRTSPSVDPKSATLSGYENIRKVCKNQQQVFNKSQDKLVRTLSLGSVGAQNFDNLWPSNDNLSLRGDTQSPMEPVIEGRKSKQREWFETSLDGPVQPTSSRSQSSMSSILQYPPSKSISPEEKYSQILIPSPEISKPLEIPAESKPNPSPIVQEPIMEFFNNNIPKNCTLIQPGGCKPYHEETKPFEMSDFYKYSTKFKKLPSKQTPSGQSEQNQNNAENCGVILKGVYQPLQPMKCQPLSSNDDESETTSILNMDSSEQSPNSELSFASKKTMWYKKKESLNSSETTPTSARSTATLV